MAQYDVNIHSYYDWQSKRFKPKLHHSKICRASRTETIATSVPCIRMVFSLTIMKALKCKTLGEIHIHHALSHKCQGPSIHTMVHYR